MDIPTRDYLTPDPPGWSPAQHLGAGLAAGRSGPPRRHLEEPAAHPQNQAVLDISALARGITLPFPQVFALLAASILLGRSSPWSGNAYLIGTAVVTPISGPIAVTCTHKVTLWRTRRDLGRWLGVYALTRLIYTAAKHWANKAGSSPDTAPISTSLR